MRRPRAAGQLLLEDCNVGCGAIVGPARALARNIGGCDNVNLMAQVIEGEQAIEEHQHTIGQGKIVLGVLTDFLQLANRVVRKITHRARREPWQAGEGSGTMLPEQLLHNWQDAALALLTSPSALQ